MKAKALSLGFALALVFAGASFTGCEFIAGLLFGGGGEEPEVPGEHVLPSTLYVHSSGSGDNSGETRNDPLPTIAAALAKVAKAAKDPSWPGKSGVAIVLLDTVTVAGGDNSISNGGAGYPPLTLRAYATGYSLIKVVSGSLTLQDITLQGRENKTAALVTVLNGHLILGTGAFIKDNGGGGVYLDGGAFTMNGGTISGNTGEWGGGVGVVSGTFTMNGGTIARNTASEAHGGGGVYVTVDVNFTKGNAGGIIYGKNEGDTLKNSPDAVFYGGGEGHGRADTLNVNDAISTNPLSGW
jgi:hypothetical protein